MARTEYPIKTDENRIICPFCQCFRIHVVRADLTVYGNFCAQMNCSKCERYFFMEFTEFSKFDNDSTSQLCFASYDTESKVCTKCEAREKEDLDKAEGRYA